jgi:hypothetical protein
MRSQGQRKSRRPIPQFCLVRYCWAVTSAGDGRANARVAKAFPNGDGEDLWTRWFLTL